MPKNKFQEVIFTIMMVLVMVYAMICYNIALATVPPCTCDFRSFRCLHVSTDESCCNLTF